MSGIVVEMDAAAYVPIAEDFRLKNNTKELVIDTNFTVQSFWKEAFIRFVRKKSATVGLILIALIVVLAAVGPETNACSYSAQNIAQKNFAPRAPGLEWFGTLDGSETILMTDGSRKVNSYREKKLDNVYYWFGSDNFGRDLWTRTWSSAHVSLTIAITVAAIDMLIDMSYGLISGYFGSKVNIIMQRILEILNGTPRLVTVTLLLLILKPEMLIIIFAPILTEWIGTSRTARAGMLKLKEQELVLVSRTLEAGPFFIILKEILSNIIGPIITQVTFPIPAAIFTEAFLSFVGLGIPVPKCSLGSLISDGFNSFMTHSFQILPPITVMVLLMLSSSLVGDGLREALDPKLKET